MGRKKSSKKGPRAKRGKSKPAPLADGAAVPDGNPIDMKKLGHALRPRVDTLDGHNAITDCGTSVRLAQQLGEPRGTSTSGAAVRREPQSPDAPGDTKSVARASGRAGGRALADEESDAEEQSTDRPSAAADTNSKSASKKRVRKKSAKKESKDSRSQRMIRLRPSVDAMLRELADYRGLDLTAATSVAIAEDHRRIFGSPKSNTRGAEDPHPDLPSP